MLNQVSAVEQQDSEEIDQIRNLLFGDIQRENQKRFAELEQQIQDLKQSMDRQLSAMAADNASSQANFTRALGDAITELGKRISELAEDAPRRPAAPDTAPDHE